MFFEVVYLYVPTGLSWESMWSTNRARTYEYLTSYGEFILSRVKMQISLPIRIVCVPIPILVCYLICFLPVPACHATIVDDVTHSFALQIDPLRR